MASMHGSYRKVAETLPALKLLGEILTACGVAECRWLLDQPVSNSGRLKKVMEEAAAKHGWPWHVELTPNPDRILANPASGAIGVAVAVELPPQPKVVVATADSAILDRCPAWFNLARETIVRHIPDAWVLTLAPAGIAR